MDTPRLITGPVPEPGTSDFADYVVLTLAAFLQELRELKGADVIDDTLTLMLSVQEGEEIRHGERGSNARFFVQGMWDRTEDLIAEQIRNLTEDAMTSGLSEDEALKTVIARILLNTSEPGE